MKLAAEKVSFKFAVVQIGARLHYAVPAVLAAAGSLEVLYTDACANSLNGSFIKHWPRALQSRALRRLTARTLPAIIPESRVRSSLWASLQIQLFDRLFPRRNKSARLAHRLCIGGHWLARQAVRDNCCGANALYVHPCASTDAVKAAKKRDIFVVIEAISHPFNKLVEQEEYRRFGMPLSHDPTEDQDNLAFFKEEIMLADRILAASAYVKSGLVELGIPADRIALVPYGLDAEFFDKTSAPVPGRVLYVGNIGYLKGVPYLAAAASRLREQGLKCELRAVGPFDPALVQRPEFQGLNYVGQVPRNEIKLEFLTADLFVFPTLSDGFGIVLLEALAAGLPVVCTPNCAGVVQSGHNGFVVPTRDPAALAARIREVVEDRPLREHLGRNARQSASEFTLEKYRTRLIAALQKS
jgi:glycosyltransferase involved in cell wall biosynthesis